MRQQKSQKCQLALGKMKFGGNSGKDTHFPKMLDRVLVLGGYAHILEKLSRPPLKFSFEACRAWDSNARKQNLRFPHHAGRGHLFLCPQTPVHSVPTCERSHVLFPSLRFPKNKMLVSNPEGMCRQAAHSWSGQRWKH